MTETAKPPAADDALLTRRIFPRNLTARAATPVKGNPASARPESGVDNTHPGLEFDQRNLDRAFFPGLTLDFQFLTGARVTGIEPALLPPGVTLTPADIGTDDDPLHLLYLWGRFGAHHESFRLVQLLGLDGYDVLRTVRDLEPGPVMAMIGRRLPANAAAALPDSGMGLLQYGAAINGAIATGAMPAIALPPVRDATGKLLAAMLLGHRADYLDRQGVIPAETVPPGGLTQSLCSPWQWDFADCGCHYWAASKPDIVIGADGGTQTLNFQRDRSVPPPAVPATALAAWTAGQMTQPAMIRSWETLPVVIAERETDRATAALPAIEPRPWSRDEVIAELGYLATIEHALAIEYLYAYYSLDAPRRPPADTADARQQDLFAAAETIRTIAVDEMRHLRWVNEALQLLGADVSLGRATRFADGANRITGSFTLAPLTPERLAYFIAVEAPSRVLDDPGQLDGLYGHLQRSLTAGATDLEPATERRLAEIIKMIIDEGHEHWQRFMRVEALLKPYPPADWLRVKAPPSATAGPDVEPRLALADAFYRDLLAALAVAFRAAPVARAEAILDAREMMYNLDDIGDELAALGAGLRFTLPTWDEAPLAAHLEQSRTLLVGLAAADGAQAAAQARRRIARIDKVANRRPTA